MDRNLTHKNQLLEKRLPPGTDTFAQRTGKDQFVRKIDFLDAQSGILSPELGPRNQFLTYQEGGKNRNSQRFNLSRKQIFKTANVNSEPKIPSSPSGLLAFNPVFSEFEFNHRSAPAQNIKLFFKPINKKTSRDVVYACLSKLGEMSFFRIPYSQKKGKNLGYGFVTFVSRDIALCLVQKKTIVQLEDNQLNFEQFDFQKMSPSYFQKPNLTPDSLRSPEMAATKTIVQESTRPLIHHIKPTSSQYYESIKLSKLARESTNLRFNLLSPPSAQRFRLSLT